MTPETLFWACWPFALAFFYRWAFHRGYAKGRAEGLYVAMTATRTERPQ